MRQLIIFTVLAATLIGLMSACGPSEEELQRREQARQDSLEQVRQQQIEQQRLDSIAQARQDSIDAAEKKQEQRTQIEFDENGSFTVQTEAWRSEVKAKRQAEKWRERGYEQAYVVKYGNEETGDIWFRVRLGKFATKAMAEKFQTVLSEDYNANSWISLTKEETMEMKSDTTMKDDN
ncbi:MAG: SPOR domain-containing protein [Balneolaceae bacterium]|nr:SPOR domain-containing protein [Balneolaceae bacterium]